MKVKSSLFILIILIIASNKGLPTDNIETNRLAKIEDVVDQDKFIIDSIVLNNIEGNKNYRVIAKQQIPQLEEFHTDLEITIYDLNSPLDPITTINTSVEVYRYGILKVVDANFDGYPDFCFRIGNGTQSNYYQFYVWNPESASFQPSPQLANLPSPEFDSTNKLINTFLPNTALAGELAYYRYDKDDLVCLRTITREYPETNTVGEQTQRLIIKDLKDGALIEVFNVLAKPNQKDSDSVYAEFEKWKNINYSG